MADNATVETARMDVFCSSRIMVRFEPCGEFRLSAHPARYRTSVTDDFRTLFPLILQLASRIAPYFCAGHLSPSAHPGTG